MLSSYKEERETYIGYFEVAAGLGALIGPLLGAMLYYFGGYQAPFLVIGLIYLAMVVYFKRLADKIETNEDRIIKSESYLSVISEDNSPKRILTFCDIISVVRSLFGLIVQFLCYFVMSFNTSILNTHLDNEGYSPVFFSIAFCCVSVCYALSMPLVTTMVKKMPKRGVLFIGLTLQTTGVLISGLTSIR